jgi:hypothetical protein
MSLFWILSAAAAYDDVRAALTRGDDAAAVAAARPSADADPALAILVGDLLLRHGDVEGARAILGTAAATSGPLQGVAAWRAAEASWKAGFADEAASHAALGLSVWQTAPGPALLLPWQARAAASLGDGPTATAAADRCERTTACVFAKDELAVRLAIATPDPAERAATLDTLRPSLTTAGVIRLADEARAQLAADGFPVAAPDDATAWGLGQAASAEANFREAWIWWRGRPVVDAKAWRTVGRLAGEHLAVLDALRSAPPDDVDARWSTFHIAARAGLWTDARSAIPGLPPPSAEHPRDIVARQLIAGAQWDAAAELLRPLASTGSSDGRWHQRLLAIATAMRGDDGEALRLLAPLVGRTGYEADAARYWAWRWGSSDGAAHRAHLTERRTLHWYGLLASPTEAGDAGRDGRWRGPRAEASAEASAVDLGQGRHAWTRKAILPGAPPSLPAVPLPEPSAGFRALARSAGHEEPLLPAILALADVGHDLAGVLMQAVLDGFSAGEPGWAAAWSPEERVRDAAALGDLRHAIEPSETALRELADTEARAPYLADAFPLYRPALIWREASAANVDPWLALSLLRAESAYDQGAVSRANAHGPLQILPRTGARMAVWLGEPDFRIDDLHTPETATRFGLAYLGRLLDRFDGRWPLAVAAYNTGPLNVAAWLAEQPPDTPIDRFVETIPWSETRAYVQRVAGYYATYVSLFGDGEGIVIPATVGRVDPDGVDF